MLQRGPRGIRATLGKLTAEGADATRVARTVVGMLQSIHQALAPILGDGGFSALYRRSLYLIRTDFPWLVAIYEGALVPGDFAQLEDALARQSSDSAMRAACAQLTTLHDLLISLIGGALTDQLLRPVWDNPSSGNAVQDTSQ